MADSFIETSLLTKLYHFWSRSRFRFGGFFGRFLFLRWGLQTHLFSKGGRQEFRNIWARFSSIKWGCCDWSNFIWTIILFIKLSRSSRHFLAKFRRQLLLRLGRITCCTNWNFAWKQESGWIKNDYNIVKMKKWYSKESICLFRGIKIFSSNYNVQF